MNSYEISTFLMWELYFLFGNCSFVNCKFNFFRIRGSGTKFLICYCMLLNIIITLKTLLGKPGLLDIKSSLLWEVANITIHSLMWKFENLGTYFGWVRKCQATERYCYEPILWMAARGWIIYLEVFGAGCEDYTQSLICKVAMAFLPGRSCSGAKLIFNLVSMHTDTVGPLLALRVLRRTEAMVIINEKVVWHFSSVGDCTQVSLRRREQTTAPPPLPSRG